jgi:hypothetical protein
VLAHDRALRCEKQQAAAREVVPAPPVGAARGPAAPAASSLHNLPNSVFVLALVLVITTFGFLRSPGTSDVSDAFLKWMKHIRTDGLVEGYELDPDYPPLTWVYLWAASRVGKVFHENDLIGLKIVLTAVLFVTSGLFWLWTRNLRLAVALHLALLLSSVALGYLDILVAPALLGSLWALKEKRLLLFSALFVSACLTKWQPIVLAPFFAVYVLSTQGFVKTLVKVLPPALVILGACYWAFGPSEAEAEHPIVKAFRLAVYNRHEHLLSGNALNYNWIVTHVLHVLDPEGYGGLVHGQASEIDMEDSRLLLMQACRWFFWVVYAAVMGVFLLRQKTFENLILGCLLGYLAYTNFNTNVHENHWFFAAVLAFVLYALNRAHLNLLIVLNVIANLNLFLFYGVSGAAPRFGRVVFIDVALAASVFNVLYFLLLLWWYAGNGLPGPLSRRWRLALPGAISLLAVCALPLFVFLGDSAAEGSPERLAKRQYRAAVRKTVPQQAKVIVACKDEDDFLMLGDRKTVPFLASIPANGADAIEQLEELRDQDYQFLVFPKDALWYLRDPHYRDFAKHLNEHYQRVYGDSICVIYRIDHDLEE